MRIILYAFLFVLLGFQKISADTFRSIESERINKRDSLLSIITGAVVFQKVCLEEILKKDQPKF